MNVSFDQNAKITNTVWPKLDYWRAVEVWLIGLFQGILIAFNPVTRKIIQREYLAEDKQKFIQLKMEA